ncbi:MAG: hypothetical protein PVH36_05150 [Desulfobacterales bacterium]
MASVIETALSPFHYFDMASIYNAHNQIIDGIVFFSIFLGLSKFAFHKRFPGRPGNAIAIAFSFALTIALLVMEHQFNFNLKSFGGLALGTIFLITGFFMISLARSASIKYVTSFCLSYTLIYLSVASILPNLFDYIASRAPFINGLLGIIFLISLFKTFQSLFVFIFKRHSNIQTDNILSDATNNPREIDLEDKEIRIIKSIRNRLTTLDDIMDRLMVIEKSVKKNPVLSPEHSNIIKMSLSEIANKENIFRKNYNDMYLQFKELGKIDSERLQRLEDELKTVPLNFRRFKKAEIDIEKRKLEYDRTVLDLKNRLDALIIKFNNQINASIQQLHKHPDSSLPGISDAKKTLKELKGVAENIKQLERELIHLHRTQKGLFKGERRQKK